jgi:hypothetical protein
MDSLPPVMRAIFRRVRKTIMARGRIQIIALLLFFTAVLLFELLYACDGAAVSPIIKSVLRSQDTSSDVEVITLPNSPVRDALLIKSTTKFDILNTIKNETLGFSKIFYISLPQ